MNKKTDHKETLKHAGLKNTKRRIAILEILEKQVHLLTAEQMFLELNRLGIPISQSTVYRELDSLVSKDLAVKIKTNDSDKAFYEYNRLMHRHYLICLGCKKMIAIDIGPLDILEEALKQQTKFIITDHKLACYGYCPECQAKGLPKKV